MSLHRLSETFKADLCDSLRYRWALHYGYISVTPMQASFAEPGVDSMRFGSEDQQKTKGDASEREGGGGVGIPGLWSEV